jgi:hypothetical protein
MKKAILQESMPLSMSDITVCETEFKETTVHGPIFCTTPINLLNLKVTFEHFWSILTSLYVNNTV